MNEDILKFIDCFFVLLVKNEKVHYTSSFESLLVPQIKQEWKDDWKHYLSKQFEKYEDDYDGYDQWFDELTFDTIPEKVLKQYDLPTEPITIHIGNEEYLMKNIYRIFNDFIDSFISSIPPIVKRIVFILCLRTPLVFHLIGIEDEFLYSIILGTLFIFSFLSSPSTKEDDEEDQGKLKKNEDDLATNTIAQPSNDDNDKWKDFWIGGFLLLCLRTPLSCHFI